MARSGSEDSNFYSFFSTEIFTYLIKIKYFFLHLFNLYILLEVAFTGSSKVILVYNVTMWRSWNINRNEREKCDHTF